MKVPLLAVIKDTTADTVIPAGSMVEWQPGDFAGGVASVFWLKRALVVLEVDLLRQCERMTTQERSGLL